MTRQPIITEINISGPARALGWLRLTDYALVVMCGFWALGLLSELVFNFPSGNAADLILSVLLLAMLCFAAYTGWRHVGVIDPAVWRVYRCMFPLMTVGGLFLGWPVMVGPDALAGLMEFERAQLLGSLVAVYVGSVALLGWISLILLHRMTIPAMGGTVDQILARLVKQAGTTAKHGTRIKCINKPRGLVIGVAGLLILVAITLAPIPNDEKLAEAFFKLSEQISLLGFFLLVRARRYFQIDADALLAVDRRAPILFLRSFDDDEKQKFQRSDKALLDFSLETRLSNHFSRFGPFIAIGSPQETVPQIGAARVLLADAEWQPRVLSWMRDAKLIIMYSGKTHWVNWELRQLVEQDCVTRLILMFPEIKAWRSWKRNEEIAARVKLVRQVFKDTPWEEELLAFDDFPGLRAMLFRPDGSMVMVKSRARSRDSYHLAALMAHQYLLDPECSAPSDAAPEHGLRLRRFRFEMGILAGAVAAVLGAAYLFMQTGDARLAFKKGELYYTEPVTAAEANAVGDYLMQNGFFNADRGASVHIGQKDDAYQLKFVINPSLANDPEVKAAFRALSRSIADEALEGRSVVLHLCDENFQTLQREEL